MATATSSANCGSKRPDGSNNSGQVQPGGTPDVAITINTAVVMTRGQFLAVCREIADHLSGYLK